MSFKRLVLLCEVIIGVVFFAVSISFVLSNDAVVTIDFLLSSIELNLGVVLLSFLIVGFVLGYFIRLPALLVLKSRYKLLAQRASK